jgi:X-Pro dipeptidyl-peptidase
VGAPNESLAPKAVVDWLNGRARGFRTVDGQEQVRANWSTGKVGMTGTSYNGTLPLAAATTGVEGLEAVIPDAPNTSYWHYYRANGLVRNPGGYPGEDIDVLYDFIHSRDSDRRAWCDANVRDGEMAAGRDRTTGDYNDFWRGRDYTHVVDGIRAAVFLSHGLSDWNVMPDHSIRIYRALREQGKTARLYLHQGGHGGPPPPEMMNRWFTRYLYGVENGVEDEPRSWIVREEAERDAPTPYADYPHPDAAPVTLYPSAGGHGTGSLTLGRDWWAGAETIVDNVSFGAQSLATAEWTEHRLLFATPALADSLHLSGTTRVTVRASADRPAVNLSVYLVSLPWSERRTWQGQVVRQGGLVTRGWADLQNHASLTESEPLVPGEFYTMSFDLEPDDQVIPAGQRLALMIFSSDRDFTLWPRPGAELTVDLDGTSVQLPVVGGAAAYEAATGGR